MKSHKEKNGLLHQEICRVVAKRPELHLGKNYSRISEAYSRFSHTNY
ncbi:MAG: hypothetical protein HWD61_00315 [Parachlamydiaceae bacterium]|nr:MAG: hypothetical protein HWD61_00315 [Parachlamydiaceae bacterium]